ncbi:MAG: protein BatD [Candidatus Gracilibacteria bacterium]|nr:protein BatD [Candidatus Gracilibacteria bacterium]
MYIIRKIIFVFLFILISISVVFAESTVEISLNKEKIDIDEYFDIKILIQSEGSNNIEIINIPGMEDFIQKRKSENSQMAIVNQNITFAKQFVFTLQAKKEGAFTIGPVSVKTGNELIHSNEVIIEIGEYKGTLQAEKNENNPIDSSNNKGQENQINNLKEEETTDIVKGNKQIQLDEKKEEKNQDIEGNNENTGEFHTVQKIPFSLKNYSYISLIGGIILFLFFLFLNYILKNRNTIQEKIMPENTTDDLGKNDRIKNIYNEIQKLEQFDPNIKKQLFYSELNRLIRKYYEFLGVENVNKKTLAEIKKENIDPKIISLFTTSYMHEFSESIDSAGERKQLLMNLLLYIKSKHSEDFI